MSLTVVILTKNEEKHIRRAILSVLPFSDRIVIVDSESEDRTVDIAAECGATIFTNRFVNQAQQFNWALENLPSDTDWVFRLDADEIVTDQLAAEIRSKLKLLPDEVAGVYINRHMNFLGRPVRWGGVFPIQIVRIFRFGRGRSEDRWMDEHVVVEGDTVRLSGTIVDDNLNSLSWWVDKHNQYASREVIELLNQQYHFIEPKNKTPATTGRSIGLKRAIRERIYNKLPTGTRAVVYFLYRYIFRLGFLDTGSAASFHVFQAFWYRYLVDAKLREVKNYMKSHQAGPLDSIHAVLGIRV